MVGTSHFLKCVLNKEWGLRTGNLLSHFALFEVDTYHKVIAVTDVAMNIAPNLKDKIAIVNNSVSCLITAWAIKCQRLLFLVLSRW